MVIVSFIIAVRKDNKTIHNVTSFAIHILIVILITLGLAKTSYERIITETNIYILADVSYSSNKNLDLIDEDV